MSKKISFTGTFSIGRKAFEAMLSAAGHEVISLSGKTQVLLVGEKTASLDKSSKARNLGIWVFEETDVEKIIDTLSKCDKTGYVIAWERGADDGMATERVTARPSQAVSVFFDLKSVMYEDEWFPDEDGKECYQALIGENSNARKNLEEFISENLGIDILKDEREDFFRMIFRAVCLDNFESEVEMLLEDEEDSLFPYINCTWGEVRVARSDFWEKFCHNFDFEESEEMQEFSRQKVVKNLIARYRADEEKVK